MKPKYRWSVLKGHMTDDPGSVRLENIQRLLSWAQILRETIASTILVTSKFNINRYSRCKFEVNCPKWIRKCEVNCQIRICEFTRTIHFGIFTSDNSLQIRSGLSEFSRKIAAPKALLRTSECTTTLSLTGTKRLIDEYSRSVKLATFRENAHVPKERQFCK